MLSVLSNQLRPSFETGGKAPEGQTEAGLGPWSLQAP